ncbi:g5379 [Coccomyxa elongata]
MCNSSYEHHDQRERRNCCDQTTAPRRLAPGGTYETQLWPSPAQRPSDAATCPAVHHSAQRGPPPPSGMLSARCSTMCLFKSSSQAGKCNSIFASASMTSSRSLTAAAWLISFAPKFASTSKYWKSTASMGVGQMCQLDLPAVANRAPSDSWGGRSNAVDSRWTTLSECGPPLSSSPRLLCAAVRCTAQHFEASLDFPRQGTSNAVLELLKEGIVAAPAARQSSPR